MTGPVLRASCAALAAGISLRLAAQTAAPERTAMPVPTEIWSDQGHIESTATETTSIFTGHVVVKGTNLLMHCDRLRVISSRVSDPAAAIGQPTSFKSLLATGHVDIVQTEGAREATCGRAEVFPGQNKIVLTENPVVIDHGNGSVATGDEIDMFSGQRRVEGVRVHLTLPPMKDLGFDKNQKPAAAEPAPSSAGPAAPSSSQP